MRLGVGTHCCPAGTKAKGLLCHWHDSLHNGACQPPALCRGASNALQARAGSLAEGMSRISR